MTIALPECPAMPSPGAAGVRSPSPASRKQGSGPRIRPASAFRALCAESGAYERRARGRDYDGPMGLSLVVGPAHAGKVALLLERFLAELVRDPWLVVPNRLDVDRVERDLIRRAPALLAGSIGTFDDLFQHIADGPKAGRRLHRRRSDRSPSGARSRVVSSTVCASSAATSGFADTLLQAIGELESGLVDVGASGRRAGGPRRRISGGAGATWAPRSRRHSPGGGRTPARRLRRVVGARPSSRTGSRT